MSWKRSMVVAWIAAGLAACSSGKHAGLKVSAKASATAPADAGSPVTLDAGHGIQIEEIRLVVRKVEVEGEGATCTSTPPPTPPAATPPAATPAAATSAGASGADHGGGGGSDDGPEDESCDLEQGPFLVTLSGADLLAGTHPVFDAAVPAGTYEEIALRIGAIPANRAGQAPVEAQRAALAELAGRHVSLSVRGTIDAVAFTFEAPLEARQKREGAITIDAGVGADLTFDLDASRWFTAADGSKLDPTDPAAGAAILANVRASLRLVHDEDHDGAEDGTDDPGSGGSGHG